MTYYGAKDLAASFRTVRNNTIQIAEEIPEDKYNFEPAPGVRTVAKLLVHIANGYKFNHQVHGVEKRTAMEGFNFPQFMAEIIADEQKPRSKAEIVQLLKDNGSMVEQWLDNIRALWPECPARISRFASTTKTVASSGATGATQKASQK